MTHCNPLRVIVYLLLVCLLSACALLKRPEPRTALHLRTLAPASAPAWPGSVSLRAVTANSLIETSDIVVFDGTRSMRAEGMKWAVPPSEMLRDQIYAASAHSGPGKARSAAAAAMLSINLQTFELQLDAAAPKELAAVIALTLELNCADRLHVVGPNMIRAQEPAAALTPESLVLAFNAASTRVLAEIVTAAAEMANECNLVNADAASP